ncbi:YceI family protein [Lysinibacillus sp. 54212]|uniref:YceI family protein n=1 Tax=Lysinibacillus sp. 54212 TaxID=3119829 RepID=UPI002FCC7A4E
MTRYAVDVARSEIGFSVRHMLVSKVKGKFESYSATIQASNISTLEDAKIIFEIDVASISTRDSARDQHLISADFFDADRFPKIYFELSDLIALENRSSKLIGNLTIKNITQAISFDVQHNGYELKAWGAETHYFTCSAFINRKDFGLTYNALIEAGGTIIDENILISVKLEIHSI